MKEFCFVIQPFDGSTYDTRYKDIIEPAIKQAGLEPYRIDKDSKTLIPINQIEEKISESTICLAEITSDNPNVWFELGYALALQKKVILICSRSRPKLPFDIQHRSVLFYTETSISDFEKLKQDIIKKIKSIYNKKITRFILPKTETDWIGISNKSNPQQSEYLVLINNYIFKELSCSFKTKSNYFRFGFKMTSKNGNIFGDSVIKSTKTDEFLFHLGKNIESEELFFVPYKKGIRLVQNESIFPFNKDQWYKLKIGINKSNICKFYIDNQLIYQIPIEFEIRNKLIMYIWGDEHEVKVNVKQIKLKTIL